MPRSIDEIRDRIHDGEWAGPVPPVDPEGASPPVPDAVRGAAPRTEATALAALRLYGFTADWDLVPDLDAFARCVGDAFRELRAAVP
jgi:hypothetical protein